MLLTQLLTEVMAQWIPPATDRDADRYAQIADDALSVASEMAPDDDELAFSAATLLLSIASYESGFRDDVRGDNGKAYCLLQIHTGPGLIVDGDRFAYSSKGWHGKDLVRDRKKCFRAGFAMIAESARRCSKYGDEASLSVYTSGRCLRSEPKAIAYWSRAKKAFME